MGDYTVRRHRLGYLPSLDGMRGAAVLAVMAFHGSRSTLPGGFIGVDIFFVLSGFLVTSLLVQEWDERHSIDLKRFFARRALRLLPALATLLVVYVGLVSVLPIEVSLQTFPEHLLDAALTLLCISNWPIALGLKTIPLLGHTWALALEVQFYILWAFSLILLLRLIPSRRLLVEIILGIALCSWVERVCLLIAGVERLFFRLDTRLDPLMVGAALGVALSANIIPGQLRQRQVVSCIAVASALGLILIAAVVEGGWPSTYYLTLPLVALLSGIIVLHLNMSGSGILRKALEFPALVWIGKISYGLYLWHFPIFRLMQVLYARRLPVLVVGVPLTFAITVLSYYVLEQPFLRMKSRLRA